MRIIRRIDSEPLVVKFCNIKEWSVIQIFKFYKDNRIAHTEEGVKRGYQGYTLTMKDPNHAYVMVEHDYINSTILDDFKGFFVMPFDDNYVRLWDHLEKSQKEYESFLTKCTGGHLDIAFLNEIAQRVSPWKVHFSEHPEAWRPNFHYYTETLSIEDFIDRSIIVDFMSPECEKYSSLRRCHYCKKFFIQEKTTGKYCSNNCRKYAHRDRKQKVQL